MIVNYMVDIVLKVNIFVDLLYYRGDSWIVRFMLIYYDSYIILVFIKVLCCCVLGVISLDCQIYMLQFYVIKT